MSTGKSKSTEQMDFRVPASSGWAGLWRIFAVIGAIGMGASLYGMTVDRARFGHAYLFGFLVFLTIGLGAMFFVLIQHLTSAGWSVTVRRTAEFYMAGLPIMAVLFIPIVLVMNSLFPWLGHGEHGAHGAQHGAATHASASPEHGGASEHGSGGHETAHANETAHRGHAAHHVGRRMSIEDIEHETHARIIRAKAPYLNSTFFLIRLVIYFAAWIFIAMRLFGWSTQQDRSRDPKLTVRQQRFSYPVTFVFGFTMTFAVFDWVMSLMPTWFSTIYGVQFFSSAAVAIFAVVIVTTMAMRRSGLVGDAINTEHLHDLGKLMFGFTAFWAYISFSQFFLIWYAGIPEETQYYHARWANGPWKTVSIALVVGHFIVPFYLLMSRNVKRHGNGLLLGAIILLVMHVVEMYWHVLPNFRPGLTADQPGLVQIHWMDITSLLGVGGCYLALVFYRMTRHPVIPVGDPRLSRSLRFQNA